MILCETLLISLIGILGFYVTVTDFQQGIIQNKRLLQAFMIGFVLNLFYYGLFAKEFFQVYAINFCVITILSVCLYAMHFWAAGDSKLFIVMTFLFPARFYDFGKQMLVPGIYSFVIIFLLAYFYVIIDTIILKIKKVQAVRMFQIHSKNLKLFLLRYFMSFLYLNLFSACMRAFFYREYEKNQVMFMFFHIFLAVLIQKVEWLRRYSILIFVAICNVILFMTTKQTYDFHILWKSYLILLLVLAIRYVVSGYNYKEILTKEVQKGMILSSMTVMKFLPSRVKGLPRRTGEDMKYRISEEEAVAVKRWEKSKYGEPTVVIVRKVPFAVFITMGMILLFLIRVLR